MSIGLAVKAAMLDKNQKRQPAQADGGAGRGIPLGGHDDRPPTGYLDTDVDARDFGLEEDEDPADRRKDPLRR